MSVFKKSASLLAAVLFLPILAHAGAPSSPLPGTTIPQGDLSISMLNQLFGTGWEQWITPGQGVTAGAGSALATMLRTFNTILLAGVTALIVYTYGIGIADTAHQGETLGKKYSTLWTPIRQGGALVMLAPYPGLGGLSFIQALVVWMLLPAIGFANTVADAGLNYMSQNAGILSPPAISNTLSRASMGQLLNMSVESQYLKNEGYTTNSSAGFKCLPFTGTLQTGYMCDFVGLSVGGQVLPPSTLGGVQVNCGSSSREGLDMCVARTIGVTAAFNALAPVGAMITSTQGASSTGATPTLTGQTNTLSAAESAYQNAVQNVYSNITPVFKADYTAGLNKMVNTVKSEGWSSLGMYFYDMSKYQDQSSADFAGTVQINSGNAALLPANSSSGLVADLSAAHTYLADGDLGYQGGSINVAAQSNTLQPQSGIMAFLVRNLSIESWANGLTNYISGGGDPIMALQSTGNTMLTVAESGYLAYTGLRVFTATGKGWNKSIPGRLAGLVTLGSSGGIAAGAVTFVKMLFLPLVLVLVTYLVAGITLAYYLPLAPAIIYGFAVLGWLVLVVEAFIAAPIWMAAHALPSGEGLTGDHGRHGYPFLLDLLLRPVLLVIGFFLSIILIEVGTSFMLRMMEVAFADEWQGKVFGLLTFVASVLILAAVVYGTVNRMLEVITYVPKTVIRWIGLGIGSDMGEASHEKNIYAGVARGGGQGLQSSQGAVSSFQQEDKARSAEAAKGQSAAALPKPDAETGGNRPA